MQMYMTLMCFGAGTASTAVPGSFLTVSSVELPMDSSTASSIPATPTGSSGLAAPPCLCFQLMTPPAIHIGSGVPGRGEDGVPLCTISNPFLSLPSSQVWIPDSIYWSLWKQQRFMGPVNIVTATLLHLILLSCFSWYQCPLSVLWIHQH